MSSALSRVFVRYCRFERSPMKPRNPNLQFSARSSDGPVMTEIVNSIVTFRLRRPEALNSLSLEMIRDMRSVIAHTQNNSDISGYYLEAPGKVFCAGGDIKALYQEAVPKKGMEPDLSEESMKLRKEYFRHEYTLNYMIAKLKKPFLSHIEGACIGGGVGLVTHGSHSVVKTKATMQMPECIIGFFPDVGAGSFLGCIPKNVGVFLGMSGIQVNAEDCNQLGLATNFTRLQTDDLRSKMISMGSNKELIKATLTSYLIYLGSLHLPLGVTVSELYYDMINKIFSKPTVEEIIIGLREPARKLLEDDVIYDAYCNMCKSSPTSLKVTHRYLNMAKNMSLEECLKCEYRISQNFMRHPDFYEGVRAQIIDKDKRPKWSPKYLEDVTPEMVDAFFELPPGCEDLDVVSESQKIEF